MTNRIPLALALTAALIAPVTAQDVRKGSITVANAWSRATAPRAEIGAGFLTIRNGGGEPDRLVSATSPRAKHVEIHTMSLDDGVMRMRPLPNGLEIAAGGVSTLAPGGNHIMLIGLTAPLKAGQRVPVTLRFAHAGTVRITLLVGTAGAAAPANEHEHGGHH